MTRLLVCDLDGTLLHRGASFSQLDIDTLTTLGRGGAVRAIATGRALATAIKVIPADFPIDYLIFSSGAGILDWRSREVLVRHRMEPHEVHRATETLFRHDLDFMIHAPIPEQHLFQFHRTTKSNPDFERRLARYAADGRALELGTAVPASQLLAVSPSGDPDEPYRSVQRELTGLSVIRATSPLDGHSMWIEIFAAEVSKSQAAAWLAKRHDVAPENTFAIGNDYNDWDLLQWAANAVIVDNAPLRMREEFSTVVSLSEWLGSQSV